jgi:protocatechuate 4,5-dioxygenase beta chain
MAEIVAGIGVPHTPSLPAQIAKEGPASDLAVLFREVAGELAAARPDALIVFADDHFNTFFLDNFPTFAIGIADRTTGPNDHTAMPGYELAVHDKLAAHIHAATVEGGFDLAFTQDFGIDHALMVPLHFLTPEMKIPIVPLWINCLVPPLPGTQRAHAFGRAVRAAVESFPHKLRVAVLCSGHFSLEIGTPRIPPNDRAGIPDPDWVSHVTDHLRHARVARLIEEATAARLAEAGNIAGELLNWIAMLGVIGDHAPRFIEAQPALGHAFAVWRWN